MTATIITAGREERARKLKELCECYEKFKKLREDIEAELEEILKNEGDCIVYEVGGHLSFSEEGLVYETCGGTIRVCKDGSIVYNRRK
ncbi:MAG: hypothetical protein J7J01_00905 [Methanophagales archaeon]|nr:hypothetical protein [Methanophagales archaeon]